MRDTDISKKRVPVGSENKIGTARKYLGQLQYVYPNIPIKFQRINTPDGTQYFVSDYHGRKTIEIIKDEQVNQCSLYLESGIYHVPPGDLYVAAQNPVIEYKLTYFPSNEPEWFGQIYVEYQDENYGMHFPNEFRIASGERITNPYDEELPLYPNVITFNNIIHKHPASQWTGLARLFMQSIYGAYRKDLSAVIVGEYLWDIGDVLLGGYLLRYHFQIFRDDDTLTYKVAEVYNTSVIIRTLELSYCGQTMLNWYRSNESEITDAKEKSKIEAYIFSGANIGDIEQRITFDAGVVGSALYYSWKSNSNGNKFAVVTQWQDDENFQYESTLSEISLQYNHGAEEGKQFSVNVTRQQTARYFLTAGIDRLWTPSGIGGMDMLVPYSNNDTGAEQIGGDAAVYCFYKANDVLKIIYFKGSVGTNQGASESGRVDHTQICSNDLPSYSSVNDHYLYKHGFDEAMYEEHAHDRYKEWWTVQHVCGVLGGSCMNTLPDPCCTYTCRSDGLCPGYDPALPENEDLWPTSNIHGRTKVGYWQIWDVKDTGVTKRGNSMMIIPYDDAAAVFIVNHQKEFVVSRRTDYRDQTSSYIGDAFYSSSEQCKQLWYGETDGVPNPRIAPETCFPSKPPDTDWDCCVYNPDACEAGSCRPPQPCGGDGDYSYGLPHQVQWDLMNATVSDYDGACSETELTEMLYNVNGSHSFTGGSWSTMLNAEVWANPHVGMEVRTRASAVYKLDQHNMLAEGDGVFTDSKYKYYIGWQ